jgi:hypothetical protein
MIRDDPVPSSATNAKGALEQIQFLLGHVFGANEKALHRLQAELKVAVNDRAGSCRVIR